MNVHMIHGRLTRDPEFTPGSEPTKDRSKFTVAVDRKYGDEADFFDCVIFGKRAGVIEKYFGKGSEITITGRGQINSYEGKDGSKRKSYSIVVDDFDFCGSKSGTNAAKQATSDEAWSEQEADIPF